MEAEIKLLLENKNLVGVQLVDPPVGHWLIFWTVVFNGRKAHLVAREFSQIKRVGFDKTYNPIVNFLTICIMLSLAISRHSVNIWRMKHPFVLLLTVKIG